MLHDWTGLRSQTGVEGRLSTAGLVMWEVNTQAKAAENADYGFTSFWVERIDQTRDEELDSRHESIVIRFRFQKSKSEILKVWYDSFYEYIPHTIARRI
jgi:hypothetical protein